jgi:hypothetical protein
MKLKYHCRFGRLLIAVVISGCASFEPRLRLHDVLGDRTSTAKAEQESLEIAIEEFVSEEKSRQAFEAVSQLMVLWQFSYGLTIRALSATIFHDKPSP